MSLKITVEVDGQSEHQLAPVVGQWVARHSESLATQNDVSAPTYSSDFYHENAALLQQQIQQLMAQNKLLQQQVSQSQRLLAGAPQPYALPQADDSQREIAASAVAPSYDKSAAPPLLPMQYQLTQGEVLRDRFQRLAIQLPARLWQTLIWLAFGKEWLLLLLLLCSGLSGTFILASRRWPPPEFIDSSGGSPGTVVTPEPMPKSAEPKETAPTQPALPTSKAGSHPPPPPAFQQP